MVPGKWRPRGSFWPNFQSGVLSKFFLAGRYILTRYYLPLITMLIVIMIGQERSLWKGHTSTISTEYWTSDGSQLQRCRLSDRKLNWRQSQLCRTQIINYSHSRPYALLCSTTGNYVCNEFLIRYCYVIWIKSWMLIANSLTDYLYVIIYLIYGFEYKILTFVCVRFISWLQSQVSRESSLTRQSSVVLLYSCMSRVLVGRLKYLWVHVKVEADIQLTQIHLILFWFIAEQTCFSILSAPLLAIMSFS